MSNAKYMFCYSFKISENYITRKKVSIQRIYIVNTIFVQMSTLVCFINKKNYCRDNFILETKKCIPEFDDQN